MLIVLDTNIIVSSLLSLYGNEARLMSLVYDRVLVAAVSPTTLAEYERVLTRPKFRLAPSVVERTLYPLRNYSTVVHPANRLTISPDESDNRFLECAQAARADFH